MAMKKVALYLSLFIYSWTVLNAQVEQATINTFDQYVESARKAWDTPGLAIAVVKDGEVVFAKGYGVLEVGKTAKVNTQSIFGCASTTKAMTAAAMAMLVDEGKADWEDPVAMYLPDFQLSDPFITHSIRIKDLFTHNTGIGNADFLWVRNDLSEDEILHQMRYAPISYPMRGGYTYQNIMYLAAGKVIEKLSGMSWSAFLQERIFDPLDMNRTFPYLEQAQQQPNRFTPHDYVDGKLHPMPNTSADRIGPAGSAWSCVDDMAKWMLFLLNEGNVDDQQLLKPESHHMLFTPQIIIPVDQFYPSTELTMPHWTTYALGWFQHDYNGHFVSFHTGSLGGNVAIHGLLPDQELGVYILANRDHTEVRHALMYKAFDAFGQTGVDRDWSTDLKAIYDQRAKKSQWRRQAFLDSQVPNTKPSKPLSDYTGEYSDPFYGTAKVTLEDETLHLSLTSQTYLTLEHFHYDTFMATWDGRPWDGKSAVKFELDVEGEVNAVEVAGMRFGR